MEHLSEDEKGLVKEYVTLIQQDMSSEFPLSESPNHSRRNEILSELGVGHMSVMSFGVQLGA